MRSAGDDRVVAHRRRQLQVRAPQLVPDEDDRGDRGTDRERECGAASSRQPAADADNHAAREDQHAVKPGVPPPPRQHLDEEAAVPVPGVGAVRQEDGVVCAIWLSSSTIRRRTPQSEAMFIDS